MCRERAVLLGHRSTHKVADALRIVLHVQPPVHRLFAFVPSVLHRRHRSETSKKKEYDGYDVVSTT